MIASHLVGVSSMAGILFRDTHVNTEKLWGCKRYCSNEVLEWCAINCLACWPLERFSLQLLEDDRLFLHAPGHVSSFNVNIFCPSLIRPDTELANTNIGIPKIYTYIYIQIYIYIYIETISMSQSIYNCVSSTLK